MIVRVEYRGGHDRELDDSIRRIAGRDDVGTGYTFATQTRDLDFEFKRMKFANACVKRIHAWFGHKVKARVV